MFCKACGQSIDRGDKFCRNCGVALAQEPFEAAVAASGPAKVAETPLVVATSTALLQRPLPIPKHSLLEPAGEASSGAAAAPVEVKAGAEEAAHDDGAAKTATEKPAAEGDAQTKPERQPTAEVTTKSAAEPPAAAAVQSAPGPQPQPATVAASTAPEQQLSLAGIEAKPVAEPQAQPANVSVPIAPEPQTAPVAAAASPGPSPPPAEVVAQPAPAKADTSEGAASRPVRLCPQCHRLVGDDDVVCERCKAKLEPTTPEPAPVSPDYGVPSFAGYAEKADKREIVKASAQSQAADPSGVDAISNLRLPRRRRLPVVEVLVAVVLLGGAGVAVWMLRSSVPAKTATQAVNVDVNISPARAKVSAGHGYDLAATVTGADNYNVDWSVDEGDSGGRIIPRGAKAKGGAVSSLAVYMAPKTPGTYHVTATSKADPGKTASATITVTK